ncbi:FecR domain-containing protein [Pendulispora brunnea]|uniref:FecR domain-containing protein n=1 Tax=Pendulispora brunnea TaxID=2905690 RepID=A0ABZ2KBH1_9BACT
MSWSDELGRQVKRDLDVLAPGDATVERARGAFLAALKARRGPRRSHGWAIAAAMASAAAIIAIWMQTRVRAPLTFTIQAEPGMVGAWIAPRVETPLHFSDGTSVVLSARARARVVALHANGADLVLEDGAARIAVVHHENTAWTVHAGPFEVAVQGTRFLAVWDAPSAVFRLEMEEGSVLVTGCHVEPRRAIAGERLEWACPEARSEEAPADAGPVAQEDVAQREVVHHEAWRSPTRAEVPRVADAEVEYAEIDAAAPRLTLSQRFARGEYAEAYAEIDGRFDEACARADAEELALIADAARLTGHLAEARRALRILRARFARSHEGVVASFHLGRIEADDGHPAEAAAWFERYVSEAPDGELAREAQGRLIEALTRSGDAAGARAAAERYLKLYPRGPHARVARDVIGTP